MKVLLFLVGIIGNLNFCPLKLLNLLNILKTIFKALINVSSVLTVSYTGLKCYTCDNPETCHDVIQNLVYASNKTCSAIEDFCYVNLLFLQKF